MTEARGNQRAPEVAGGLSRCSKAAHCAASNKAKQPARHKEVLPEGSSLLQLMANNWLHVLPTKAALNDLAISAEQNGTSSDDHRCTRAATCSVSNTSCDACILYSALQKELACNSTAIQRRRMAPCCSSAARKPLWRLLPLPNFCTEATKYTGVLSSCQLENWTFWQKWASFEKNRPTIAALPEVASLMMKLLDGYLCYLPAWGPFLKAH